MSLRWRVVVCIALCALLVVMLGVSTVSREELCGYARTSTSHLDGSITSSCYEPAP